METISYVLGIGSTKIITLMQKTPSVINVDKLVRATNDDVMATISPKQQRKLIETKIKENYQIRHAEADQVKPVYIIGKRTLQNAL